MVRVVQGLTPVAPVRAAFGNTCRVASEAQDALGSALRFVVACLVLVPAYLVSVRRSGDRLVPGSRDLALVFLQALTGIFGFNVALLYGLRHTSAATGGMIMSLTPAVVVLLSVIILRERPSPRRLAGVALALLGLAVMNAPGAAWTHESGSDTLLGNLLVLAAVVGEGLFTVLGKEVSRRVPPLAVATWVSVFGLVQFAIPGLAELGRRPLASLGPGDWALVAYYGLVVTVVSFYLWYYGLARVAGATAGVFMAVLPVSAVLLSWAVLGERVGLHHLAAGVLVLAAIGLTTAETDG